VDGRRPTSQCCGLVTVREPATHYVPIEGMRLLHRSPAAAGRGGTGRPLIDRSYPLAEVPEAMRRLDLGRTRGTIVITL
jgi:hypothetical protein